MSDSPTPGVARRNLVVTPIKKLIFKNGKEGLLKMLC
jgi:hypothetical protein